MPSAAIAQALLGGRGTHGVTEFAVSDGAIRLHLAPWSGPPADTVAVFGAARLMSVETDPNDPGDLELPWDVLGVDGDELGSGRWRFVLHCAAIAWRFEADWPVITPARA